MARYDHGSVLQWNIASSASHGPSVNGKSPINLARSGEGLDSPSLRIS